MPAHDLENGLESQILAQLAEVERRIRDLEGERLALQRLVTKVRQQNIALKDVTRKNSFDRILVESKIMECLREAGKAVPSRTLLAAARSVSYNLKDSTFRSHLHRMKEGGQIKQAYGRGSWMLAGQSFDAKETK